LCVAGTTSFRHPVVTRANPVHIIGVESLAVVIPFPLHRVRRRITRKTEVFAALLDEARIEQAQQRMLLACTGVVALLSVVLELVIG
jgi:hypothetical protein